MKKIWEALLLLLVIIIGARVAVDMTRPVLPVVIALMVVLFIGAAINRHYRRW